MLLQIDLDEVIKQIEHSLTEIDKKVKSQGGDKDHHTQWCIRFGRTQVLELLKTVCAKNAGSN